jgi:hypothetical protein
MKRSQGVGPALRDQAALGLADLRPAERVIEPALRLVHVEVGRHDVIVTGQHDRRARGKELGGVGAQPLELAQLVIEFWAGRGIVVRQIEASNHHAVYSPFKVATL